MRPLNVAFCWVTPRRTRQLSEPQRVCTHLLPHRHSKKPEDAQQGYPPFPLSIPRTCTRLSQANQQPRPFFFLDKDLLLRRLCLPPSHFLKQDRGDA